MVITDSENEGYLQKAIKELPSDRDYRGKVNVDGRLYWISGYKRKKAEGNGTYLKLLLTPVDK